MRDVRLTDLKYALTYNPNNGWFRWRGTTNDSAGKRAGRLEKDGYRRITWNNKMIYEHVLAWAWIKGDWPTTELDHKNRTKDDNRFRNLRPSDRVLQSGNMAIFKNNTSGYKGVYKSRKKWLAAISTGGKSKRLGLFDSPEEAAKVYNLAAVEKYGDHAYLNKV